MSSSNKPPRKSKVILADKEQRCYRVAQQYRRKYLLSGFVGLHHIVWPRIMSRVTWSETLWRKGLQYLLFVLVWPVLVLWGLLAYILLLIRFPVDYVKTFTVRTGVRSPGEKTLSGIHNAFHNMLDLPDALYIACMDEWIVILFDISVDKQYMLKFVERERKLQKNVEVSGFHLNQQMRSEVAVAREKLSKKLGHYLSDQAV